MNVHVRSEFGGPSRQRISFTINGQNFYEFVRAEDWTRAAATDALDVLEYVYKVNRQTVRFIHH